MVLVSDTLKFQMTHIKLLFIKEFHKLLSKVQKRYWTLIHKKLKLTYAYTQIYM